MVFHRLPFRVRSEHQRVFDILLKVAVSFDPPIVLRIAGGWVRNSLLQLPCNDFDVAIETKPNEANKIVTGEMFANVLMDHQRLIGEETRSIGVIRRNPQQSKHIEAASTHIYGISVDFLHLRREEYFAQDHRIPVISKGSVQEDALRRDFTINALFYNLHTQEIEDYVDGVTDLSKKILRCPLDPYETFLDDPLRILRAIRFAAQFGLVMDDTIVQAARTTDIQSALLHKVSRERISKEVTTSVARNGSYLTFHLLSKLECLNSTFRYTPVERKITPSNYALMTLPLEFSSEEICCIQHLAKQIDRRHTDTTPRVATFFLAVFAHRSSLGEISSHRETVFSDCFKLPKKTISQVQRLIAASNAFLNLLPRILKNVDMRMPEFQIENSLREIVHPKHIPSISDQEKVPIICGTRKQLFIIFRDLQEVPFEPALLCAVELGCRRRIVDFEGHSSEFVYTAFEKALRSDPSGLIDCRNWFPLIRGNEVAKHITLEKAQIKSALAKIMYLQAEKPDLSVEELTSLVQRHPSYFTTEDEK